ncbi:MAG: hypothetical protein AB1758_31970 [Candidatus Eremiobacterota bacterium]
MAVVQGPDGRFYEIPDDELKRYAVPDEKVKEVLRSQAPPGDGPPPGMFPAGGPVVIQIFTGPPPGGPDVTAQDGWGGWRQGPPAWQYVVPWWGWGRGS